MIHYHDSDEIHTLIQEVFKKRSYYVDLSSEEPYIIDAGAHIGLTTLYLFGLYPKASFLCIEPNPTTVKLLQQNLSENQVANYSIVQAALSNEKTTKNLYVQDQWSVFSSLFSGGWTGQEETRPVPVETIRLSDVLTKDVDLLKLDIEGAETQVLQEAGQMLFRVKNLICEFHQTKEHTLDPILALLHTYFHSVSVIQDERKESDRHNQLFLIEATREV